MTKRSRPPPATIAGRLESVSPGAALGLTVFRVTVVLTARPLCSYNEPAAGLVNTIASLVALDVPKGFKLNVIILMDGVKRIVKADGSQELIPHESSREFLSRFYGVNWDDFEESSEGANDALLQTTVFESVHWYKADEGGSPG
eukprot:SAG31_NODE_2504_length_5592_cov_3.052977_3_plen_144_part_00